MPKQLIQDCQLYDSKVSLFAAESSHWICQVFGVNTVNKFTVQKLNLGDFSHCDDSHSGWPQPFKAAIEEDSSQMCGQLAKCFQVHDERLHLHLIGLTVTKSVSYMTLSSIFRTLCLKPQDYPWHLQKILLCVWWTNGQIVPYELLPTGETIIAHLYSQ